MIGGHHHMRNRIKGAQNWESLEPLDEKLASQDRGPNPGILNLKHYILGILRMMLLQSEHRQLRVPACLKRILSVCQRDHDPNILRTMIPRISSGVWKEYQTSLATTKNLLLGVSLL